MINIGETIVSATESLRSNFTRSALTTLGILIGVFAIISLVTLGESAKKYVSNEFSAIGTHLMFVSPGGKHSSGTPYFARTTYDLTVDDFIRVKQYCPSLEYCAPIIFSNLDVKYGNKIKPSANVVGTTREYHYARQVFVRVGNELPEKIWTTDKRVCVIGKKIHEELFGALENPLGKFITVGESSYRVTGILEPKGVQLMFDIDELVLVPVLSAVDLIDRDDLDMMIMSCASADKVKSAEDEITRVISKRHHGKIDFSITTQSQMMESFGKIMDILTLAVSAIAAVSLIVGGVGIMNIMLVVVAERTREIGIRKSVGATNTSIMLQFLFESITVSLFGGIIGAGIAIAGMAILGYLYPNFPVTFKAWAILLGIGFSGLVGILFGIYPSLKASKLQPAFALRYE